MNAKCLERGFGSVRQVSDHYRSTNPGTNEECNAFENLLQEIDDATEGDVDVKYAYAMLSAWLNRRLSTSGYMWSVSKDGKTLTSNYIGLGIERETMVELLNQDG